MIVTHSRKVVISPIGEAAADIIDAVATRIAGVFGFETDIVPLLDSIHFAFDPVRCQYHSTPVLEKLTAAAPADALKVLGIAREELFIPILTHVYGEAELGGKSCLISTYRLKEGLSLSTDGRVYQLRIIKEAVHELGHTFDLRHCPDKSCIMHYCHSIADVDRKGGELCRYCSVLLRDELKRIRT